MTKRCRTIFPSSLNFTGWWIRSKKGLIAQLEKTGRDLRTHILYSLHYSNGQIGNGIFTTENLIKNGVTIAHSKKELDDNDETETKTAERCKVVRRIRR